MSENLNNPKGGLCILLHDGDLIGRGDRWQICERGRLVNTTARKAFSMAGLFQALFHRFQRSFHGENSGAPFLLRVETGATNLLSQRLRRFGE